MDAKRALCVPDGLPGLPGAGPWKAPAKTDPELVPNGELSKGDNEAKRIESLRARNGVTGGGTATCSLLATRGGMSAKLESELTAKECGGR